MPTVTEIATNVTNALLAALESGDVGTWVKPWKNGMPTNAKTGHQYSGLNVMAAIFTAFAKEYPTQQWATYNQWQEMGAQVRAGEKGTHMIMAKNSVKEDKTTGEKKVSRFFSTFVVFNAAQVEGYESPLAKVPATCAEVEAVLEATGANITWAGDRAFYIPSEDRVGLPSRGSFTNEGGMYSTACHEMIHWTGHPSRLNRDMTGKLGSDLYAAEELVAELGAAMACAYFGVKSELRTDHAAYLAYWIKVLRAEPTAILAVASKASQALEFLLQGQVIEIAEAA